MIAYTTVGTNDFDKAKAFYDALFSVIGAKALWSTDSFIGYGTAIEKPMFGLCKPENGQAATAGNGTMIAVLVPDGESVKAMHAKALELGGTDEGAPGPRGNAQMMIGYFRDLDGNKLAAYAPSGA